MFSRLPSSFKRLRERFDARPQLNDLPDMRTFRKRTTPQERLFWAVLIHLQNLQPAFGSKNDLAVASPFS